MKFTAILITYFTILTSLSVFAQTNTFKYSNAALKKGTLDNQFQQLNYISRTQGDYKLIRKENLDIIKANVSDSMNIYRNEIKSLKASSGSHASTTQSLQDSIQSLKADLNQERLKVDSFNFLGLSINKGTYSTIVWILILVFLLSTIILFTAFKKAKNDTIEFQNTAEKSQEEYNILRKKAMEKEQALRRQLQDELNRKSE